MILKIAAAAFTVSTLVLLSYFGRAHAQSRVNDTQDAATQGIPLTQGDTVPDVTVGSITGAGKTLRNIVSSAPALVVFYRGGWCPYCNTHLGKLQEIEDELKKLGFQIVAISPDRPSELRNTMEKRSLSFTLYSDSTMDAARAFGLAFTVDGMTNAKYRLVGINLEKASGLKHHMLPVPAAFIVDMQGIIRFAYSNSDYKTRVDTNDILMHARKLVQEKPLSD